MRLMPRMARAFARRLRRPQPSGGGASGGHLKPVHTASGKRPGDRGRVATATVALGVATFMSHDPSRSDVEWGSKGRDAWGTSATMEQKGRYVLMKELGRGGFAVVRLAMDMDTQKLLAAKIFDPQSSSKESIQAEVDVMKLLGTHENIVSLYDVLDLDDETIMLTEFVAGGELFDYIVDMGSVSEKDAAHLLCGVCRALDYVHNRGVCHRDLKPENVLLTDRSATPNVKLADFGTSRRQRRGEQIVEQCPTGTLAYWAPEIVTRQPQDLSVDMWAFGVLAYIALTGVHPFDPRGDKSDAEIVKDIATGRYDVENKWYRSLSTTAKDFLTCLLDADPAKRLTAQQAMQHPWLRCTTTSVEPFDSGHCQRLKSYQRLQHLRANVLAVIMSVQHAKFGNTLGASKDEIASRQTTAVNMDMFKETFDLLDKDESGCIDRDELEHTLLALGQQLSSSAIDDIMQQADTNGDGKISFAEFVSMMNERLFRRGNLTTGNLKAAFDTFDANHDGLISSSELEHVFHVLGNKRMSDGEICKIIDGADKNEDGMIDYTEFCALMQQDAQT